MRLRRPAQKIASILILLLALGCAPFPRFSVEVLPGYDACFNRQDGWTGGDGAYSIALSDERILWLFGDTWIGKVRDNRRLEAVIVKNTAALQQGADLLESWEWTDPEPAQQGDYYYARISQTDGHWIYSSPIWIEVEKP